VHQFFVGGSVSGITCMGWGSNVTDKTSSARKSASWDEVLAFDAVNSEDKTPLDLPRDLSMIDIERSLPKLSLLAAGGTSYVLTTLPPKVITDMSQ
jgi:anaphase-promoting complex subunit 4